VLARHGAFFGGEQFLVQFFPRAYAGEDDRDFAVGAEPGEFDEVAGKVEDFYRFAMSRTKTSPPWAMAPAWRTSWAASGWS
jgi:hypothetical protein